jgi:hypothetical protein
VFTDEHWTHLLAYVHLNPLRDRLEMRSGLYRWTSHRFYSGDETPPAWLTTAELLEMLEPLGGYAAYLKEVRARRSEEPDGFDAIVFGRRRGGDDVAPKLRRQRKTSLLSADAVLRRVRDAAGCSIAELKTVQRGRIGNPARIAAAHALVHDAKLTHGEVAKLLGMSPTDVSRALLKVRNRTPEQERLSSIVDALEALRRG